MSAGARPSAYLHPAATRKNLTILTKAQATRVVIEKGRAVGVEYVRGGKRHTARADTRSACSPAAPSTRRSFCFSPASARPRSCARSACAVAHDLPGVGKNLQDHLNVNIVQRATRGDDARRQEPRPRARSAWRCNSCCSVPDPGTSNVAEAGAFAISELGAATPDIQYHFIPAQVVDHARTPLDGDGVTLHACCLRPQSRGEIRLASTDPLQPPVMDPHYLATDYDLKILIDGPPPRARNFRGAGVQAVARRGADSGRGGGIGRRAGGLHQRHRGDRVSSGRHLQDGQRSDGGGR